MERNFLLRAVTAIVLCAGILVFCSSSQAHETDGVSNKGEVEGMESLLPAYLSQPEDWPTSSDRAEYLHINYPKILNIHSLAVDSGKESRVQKSALQVRSTMKIHTQEGGPFTATTTILKTVSYLIAVFKDSFNNPGIQAHTSSDNSTHLGDLNASGLLSPSDGKVGRHDRSLLRDISPAGLRPITSNDEEVENIRRSDMPADLAQDSESVYKQSSAAGVRHGRALLRDISPPGMWPITSDDEEFEIARRRALLALPSQEPVNANGPHYKHRRALLRDISPPGMWPITSDDDEFDVTRRRALLSHTAHSTSPNSGTAREQFNHRRALLRDISPPGMWLITSDDDEFEFTRRRALLSHNALSRSSNANTARKQYNYRRALLRDISPPGMWPVPSGDDEFGISRRRVLLSDKSYPSPSVCLPPPPNSQTGSPLRQSTWALLRGFPSACRRL